MNKFDQQKAKLNDIPVPKQLEQRLHNALAKQSKKRRKKAPLVLLVTAALALLFVSFNINTFAYYGKKLFGYEQLMDDTLAKLNESGAGQVVDESIVLQDDTTVTIEGVLSDANRFLIYYKAYNPLKSLENGVTFTKLTGFLTNHLPSSSSVLSSDQHTLTGIASYDAVNPFAKKLTVSLFDDAHNEYDFTFSYNANDALAPTLKHTINEKIKTDIGTFTIKKLTTTNASTRITGTFDKTTDRTFPIPRDFVLYADDKAIPVKESGMQSSFFSGYTMDLLFDTLPTDTKKLELKLEQSYSKEAIDVTVPLNPLPKTIVGPKNLQILNASLQDDVTEITISSEPNVIFDEVFLRTPEGDVALQTTKGFHESDIGYVRTLQFNTTNEGTDLYINNMYFLELQTDTITIFD